MRNLVITLCTFLFLTLSMSFTTTNPIDAPTTETECVDETVCMEEPDLAELEEFFCNLSFSYSQDYTCCNTDTDGCACVDLTVNGIYNPSCASNLTDIWFQSIFLCSQGPWSGVSPTIRIYVDLYAACGGNCGGYPNIPITMKYTYNCGFGTCTGTYNRTIRMIVC
ncbi:MAG: hypothetical protein AAF990_16905 [Bacteroidota bacterium]